MKPIVRKCYDAFGPDRMMWGYFGHDRAGFDREVELFDLMFDFAAEEDKEKIRCKNALKLFRWV
jgi:predicted TIM-barrel fold metal-dependent hydrolase